MSNPFDKSSFDDREQAAPSVIGPNFVSDADGEEPDEVYLPSEPMSAGDEEVTVEFRKTTDDQLAVMAYSSLDSLVRGCGDLQPWVSMRRDAIESIVRESGAELVLWDAVLPAEQQRWASPGPAEGAGR